MRSVNIKREQNSSCIIFLCFCLINSPALIIVCRVELRNDVEKNFVLRTHNFQKINVHIKQHEKYFYVFVYFIPSIHLFIPVHKNTKTTLSLSNLEEATERQASSSSSNLHLCAQIFNIYYEREINNNISKIARQL